MAKHSSANLAVMVAEGRCAWSVFSMQSETPVANVETIGAWPAKATPSEAMVVKLLSMDDRPLAEVEVETQLSPLEFSWLVHRLQH